MPTKIFFTNLIVISAIFLSLGGPVQTATGAEPAVEPAGVTSSSISGRVTDSQGNGLYGLTINADLRNCDLSNQSVMYIHG